MKFRIRPFVLGVLLRSNDREWGARQDRGRYIATGQLMLYTARDSGGQWLSGIRVAPLGV